MKLQDIIYKVLVLFMLVVLTVGVVKLNDSSESKRNFYEYKNSKINLLHVKRILPRVSYYATLAEDKSEDINRKFSTKFHKEEIENIEEFLTLAKNSEFYNIEIVAYMMLDDMDVELYKSDKFFKYAGQYSVNDYLLETLDNYGIDEFQYKNLSALKGKIYTDKDKFVNDVVMYAKLKKGSWTDENIPKLGLGKNGVKFMDGVSQEIKENHLRDEDIKNIIVNLEKALSVYEEIE
ncbi:MAG: hypothetical protein ABFQ64_10125 [Campylobacterota bacterium]